VDYEKVVIMIVVELETYCREIGLRGKILIQDWFIITIKQTNFILERCHKIGSFGYKYLKKE
jgi:hypothetical protein